MHVSGGHQSAVPGGRVELQQQRRHMQPGLHRRHYQHVQLSQHEGIMRQHGLPVTPSTRTTVTTRRINATTPELLMQK